MKRQRDSQDAKRFVSDATRQRREAERREADARRQELAAHASGVKQEHHADRRRQNAIRQAWANFVRIAGVAALAATTVLALGHLYRSATAKASLEQRGFADRDDFARVERFVGRALQGKLSESAMFPAEYAPQRRRDLSLLLARLEGAAVANAVIEDCADLAFTVPCRNERTSAVVSVVVRQDRLLIAAVDLVRPASSQPGDATP